MEMSSAGFIQKFRVNDSDGLLLGPLVVCVMDPEDELELEEALIQGLRDQEYLPEEGPLYQGSFMLSWLNPLQAEVVTVSEDGPRIFQLYVTQLPD